MEIWSERSWELYVWFCGPRRPANRGSIKTAIQKNKYELHICDFHIVDKGRGHGTELLNHMMTCVRSWKQLDQIKYITGRLSSRDDIEANIRFYKRFGFHIMRYNPGGEVYIIYFVPRDHYQALVDNDHFDPDTYGLFREWFD